MLLHPMHKKQYLKKYWSQIDILVEILSSRLLPTFPEAYEDIVQEIADLQQQAQGVDQFDSAVLTDSLLEYQYTQVDLLDSVQQALVNMFAITLYHLFEQQLTDCQTHVIGKTTKKYGGDLVEVWRNTYPNIKPSETVSDEIEQLKALCNTLKHGNGYSANGLHKKWPMYFQGSWERSFLKDEPPSPKVPQLQIPIFGNNIYVSIDDIVRFQTSLKSFWETYLTEFTNQNSEHAKRIRTDA